MSTIEYLEEERKKIWATINELSQQIIQLNIEIQKTTPEYEKEAKNASKMTSEYKNRAHNALIEIEKNKGQLEELLQNSEKILSASNSIEAADALLSRAGELSEQINIKREELEIRINTLIAQDKQLSSLQENCKKILSNATSTDNRINSLLESAAERKEDIENIYDEIAGYDTKEGKHIEGLQEKLQTAFTKIEKDNKDLKKDFENTKENLLQWKTDFIKEQSGKFVSLLNKIKDLLPGATSAGLSSSYASKKTEEINERNKAQKYFGSVIFLMSFLGIIPVVINIKLYLSGKGIEYILAHIPQITMTILPIYIPLIWAAIHFNKCINLSKKLIEEYAYKEALNRTYEGLAEQIKDLKDKDNELRREHLKIILKASGENPGNFITGYDKCDNPLIDILSKPEKLSKFLKENPTITNLLEQIIKTANIKNEEKNETESK